MKKYKTSYPVNFQTRVYGQMVRVWSDKDGFLNFSENVMSDTNIFDYLMEILKNFVQVEEVEYQTQDVNKNKNANEKLPEKMSNASQHLQETTSGDNAHTAKYETEDLNNLKNNTNSGVKGEHSENLKENLERNEIVVQKPKKQRQK